MKRAAVLISLLLLTGCATKPRYFSWSSNVGKQCFYSCESSMWTCASTCGPSIPCRVGCDNAANYCRLACPDLVEVAQQ